MYEVGNNMGKGRICRCGIKETVEHVINCEGIQMEDRIRKEWLKEVKDVEKIRKVNKWIEIYIEKREKQNFIFLLFKKKNKGKRNNKKKKPCTSLQDQDLEEDF